MASPENRSRFFVTVARRSELNRDFAYSNHVAVEQYVAELRAQRLTPKVTQGEDTWYVRLRRKGHPAQAKTFASLAEADAFIKAFEAGHSTGLVRDYTAASRVTFAQLIERYINEECRRHKGGKNYRIMLRAMVEDSTHELAKRLRAQQREQATLGHVVTKKRAMREPMGHLEWLQLPLAEVTPVHIEDFIQDRLNDVAPATVDRQLDLLRSVFKVATTVWGYELPRNPFAAVRPSPYFNERDRRLSADEEGRLVAAARAEDELRSFELAVEELAAPRVAAGRALPTRYQRMPAVRLAYEQAKQVVSATGWAHVPLYEAFVLFQLGTAARRGETLTLLRANLNARAQTAYLPDTKNGRPRRLAIRKDLLALLERLPQASTRVFDLGVTEIADAWARMCCRAEIEDLRIHDLRHEAISRAAESRLFPTVIDLQAFSGHRDIRSLLRYTHLCATQIAQTLDQAEAARQAHRGRQRVRASAMPMHLAAPLATSTGASPLSLSAPLQRSPEPVADSAS